MAEQLKGFSFANRAGGMVDKMSKAECRHVKEEIGKQNQSGIREIEKMLEGVTGKTITS